MEALLRGFRCSPTARTFRAVTARLMGTAAAEAGWARASLKARGPGPDLRPYKQCSATLRNFHVGARPPYWYRGSCLSEKGQCHFSCASLQCHWSQHTKPHAATVKWQCSGGDHCKLQWLSRSHAHRRHGLAMCTLRLVGALNSRRVRLSETPTERLAGKSTRIRATDDINLKH